MTSTLYADFPNASWLPVGWLVTKLADEEAADRLASTYQRMGSKTKVAPANSGGFLVAWSKKAAA